MNHHKQRLWWLAIEAGRPLTADELAQRSGLPRGNVVTLIRFASPPGAWRVQERTVIREPLYEAVPEFEWSEAVPCER